MKKGSLEGHSPFGVLPEKDGGVPHIYIPPPSWPGSGQADALVIQIADATPAAQATDE